MSLNRVQIAISSSELTAFSNQLTSISIPIKQINNSLSRLFQSFNRTSIHLRLLVIDKGKPLKELAAIISSLNINEYEYIIKNIEVLTKSEDLRKMYNLVDRMEKAFNFGKLAIKDTLTLIRVEDMQADLINIKRQIHNIIVDPSEKFKNSPFRLDR